MDAATRRRVGLLLSLSLPPALAWAQEMPKGFSLPIELGQGFVHRPAGPNLYLATLQLAPQWTLLPGRLRGGLVLGAFYPGRGVGGLVGGRLTVNVLNGPPVLLASSFHVHLLAEYLPAVRTPGEGGHWRQWAGGGVGLETSNLLGLALKLHRDFQTPATYGQLALTLNLRYRTTVPPPL